jgi:hypothetical protein
MYQAMAFELVVAHDRLCGAGVEHLADDADGLQLTRPAVYQVADEDRTAVRVAPGAHLVPVAQSAQQGGQLVRVAVDVADDVVSHV